jgi:hypothetical protein
MRHQRYLNARYSICLTNLFFSWPDLIRFAKCGAEEARKNINAIKDAIGGLESYGFIFIILFCVFVIMKLLFILRLKLVKTISEYVWYDDHRSVDNGWIDFTAEEKNEILSI